MANYMGKRETEAIVEFSKETTPNGEKTKLFEEIIHPAFKRLGDELIKRYNLKGEDPNNDLRDDLVVDMIEKIPRLDPTRGSAFSFFNMCTNNYLRAHILKKKRNVQIKNETGYDNDLVQDEYSMDSKNSELQEQLIDKTFSSAGEDGEFVHLIKENLVKYAARSKDEDEKMIIKTLIVLVEDAGWLEVGNKKDILSHIRTITGFETRDISKHIKNIKEIWFKTYRDYHLIND